MDPKRPFLNLNMPVITIISDFGSQWPFSTHFKMRLLFMQFATDMKNYNFSKLFLIHL